MSCAHTNRGIHMHTIIINMSLNVSQYVIALKRQHSVHCSAARWFRWSSSRQPGKAVLNVGYELLTVSMIFFISSHSRRRSAIPRRVGLTSVSSQGTKNLRMSTQQKPDVMETQYPPPICCLQLTESPARRAFMFVSISSMHCRN